jgi:hypothetical protein
MKNDFKVSSTNGTIQLNCRFTNPKVNLEPLPYARYQNESEIDRLNIRVKTVKLSQKTSDKIHGTLIMQCFLNVITSKQIRKDNKLRIH